MSDRVLIDCGTGRIQRRQFTADETAQQQSDEATDSAQRQQERAAAANGATLRDRIDQAITTLENAAQNWDTLTAAQKDAALRLNVRVTARLARLTANRLDAVS